MEPEEELPEPEYFVRSRSRRNNLLGAGVGAGAYVPVAAGAVKIVHGSRVRIPCVEHRQNPYGKGYRTIPALNSFMYFEPQKISLMERVVNYRGRERVIITCTS